jgi:hypothetical protein
MLVVDMFNGEVFDQRIEKELEPTARAAKTRFVIDVSTVT